jgi:hypothetical protein
MTAIQKNLGLTTERFASPLDYNTQVYHYYIPHGADQVFGANHEAFSATWEGASICNPHYDHNEMEKVVRRAIHSSSDREIPCLTTFVLPWYPNDKSAHLKYMKHPLLHSGSIP